MPIYTGMVLYLEELFQTLRFPCHDQSDHDTGGFDVQERECNIDYSMSQFVQLDLSLKNWDMNLVLRPYTPFVLCSIAFVSRTCTSDVRRFVEIVAARAWLKKAAPSYLIETREHGGFEIVSSR